MAATFTWCEDNGASTGSPAKGTTRTGFSSGSSTDINWKNIDDCTNGGGTAYTANPITAGNNSYEKYTYGKFSGTFNQISAGLFAPTTWAPGTGITLYVAPACTGDGDRILYTTPATTAKAALTSMTQTAIGSGRAVFFGATGPEATGKAATMTTNPCYTNYLATQLQTTSSAAAGDTATATMTLRYNEN